MKHGLKGVCKRNRKEMDKYGLWPYFKTREFRKQIASIYYPIEQDHSLSAQGVFPVFKLGPEGKPPSTAVRVGSSRMRKIQLTNQIRQARPSK